jgi:lysyl-tRNA synthetase class 2
VKSGDGSIHRIDFSRPWRRVDLLEEIERHAGVHPEAFSSLESAKAAMERCGLPTENEHHVGGIIEKLLERFVEPTLIEPTFVVGYPIETSPLAKKDPKKPGFTRRFEGYVRGREVCNAFSEINDPIDQLQRFLDENYRARHGDEEAHPIDEDFIEALCYGMPPTGGFGMGIDRLTMIFTDTDTIREVILFPHLRSIKEEEEEVDSVEAAQK